MRRFVVVPGRSCSWPDMPDPARVVTRFLAQVRVTGDPVAARALMADPVAAHQMVAERDETVVRSPEEYAEHVRDMLRDHGPFELVVTELLVDGDRVFVRWNQHGRLGPSARRQQDRGRPLREVGSAVYRVAGGRIQEYWIQLDRAGIERQAEAYLVRPAPTAASS